VGQLDTRRATVQSCSILTAEVYLVDDTLFEGNFRLINITLQLLMQAYRRKVFQDVIVILHIYRPIERPTICTFGTAFSTRSHSPFYMLLVELRSFAKDELTIIHDPVRIVKVDAVIRIRENMNIVVLDSRKIELVK
jgi:hypothetical protein